MLDGQPVAVRVRSVAGWDAGRCAQAAAPAVRRRRRSAPGWRNAARGVADGDAGKGRNGIGKTQAWARLRVDFKFDRYTRKARVLPVYLTAAPVVLAIAATLPEGLNLPLAGVSAIVFPPLLYFMSQVASDFGKRLEPALWDSWGGPPTTQFLRHDNEQLNPVTRARIHAKLRAFGLRVPTAEEEKSDRERALEFYSSAVDDIRRRTRDSKRFHLVYEGNIEYGYRRNMLGLKPVGLAIAALAVVASGWSLFYGWHTDGVILPGALVITLLNTCVALGWLIGVRSATVRITADRYARYLLEAALDLEAPT